MEQAFAGFKRTDLAGVPVLWLADHRFKTFAVRISARRPLDDRAAARSLLPALLLQGTANYPDRPSLARRMESLYGAMIAPACSKEGEVHVLRNSVPDRGNWIGFQVLLAGVRKRLQDVPGQPRVRREKRAQCRIRLARVDGQNTERQ